MSFHEVPVGTDVPSDINVIVEIPMNSPAIKCRPIGLLRMEDAESARREILEAVERFDSAPDRPDF